MNDQDTFIENWANELYLVISGKSRLSYREVLFDIFSVIDREMKFGSRWFSERMSDLIKTDVFSEIVKRTVEILIFQKAGCLFNFDRLSSVESNDRCHFGVFPNDGTFSGCVGNLTPHNFQKVKTEVVLTSDMMTSGDIKYLDRLENINEYFGRLIDNLFFDFIDCESNREYYLKSADTFLNAPISRNSLSLAFKMLSYQKNRNGQLIHHPSVIVCPFEDSSIIRAQLPGDIVSQGVDIIGHPSITSTYVICDKFSPFKTVVDRIPKVTCEYGNGIMTVVVEKSVAFAFCQNTGVVKIASNRNDQV